MIADDRLCPKCSYNIRGLPVGGVCPECGTAIIASTHSRKYTREVPIHEVSRGYMRLLGMGFTMLAVGGLGGVLVAMMMVFGTGNEMLVLFSSVALSVVWSVGVLLVVRPRPLASAAKPGEVEWKWLRRVAVAGAVGKIVVPGLILAADFLAPVLWGPLVLLLNACDLTALCATAIYASFLADWASDTGLADRFRTMVWVVCASVLGIVIFKPIVDFGPSGIHLFALLGLVFSVIGLVVGTLTMNIGWLQCISMISWAQRNARAALDREVRRAERRRKEDEARLRSADYTRDPEEVRAAARAREEAARVDIESRRPKPGGSSEEDIRPGKDSYRVKSGEDLNPYELED
ncbi:MAG: hypothetical protein ACTS3F_05940 [Phycisphaerales bacterium]